MDNNSFVFPFKTPGGFYIYDTNTDMVLKVKKDIWESLKGIKGEESQNKKAESGIRVLKEDGFLSSHRVKKIQHPATNLLKYYQKNKVRMIILQVTQECNLRCSYCAYSGNYKNRKHSAKNMPIEIAKKSIDFLIKHSKDNINIGITFYGGEPLLKFDFIKECVYYAEKHAEGKKIVFTLTTNATLLTERIIDFFSQHNISIMISLDGPRKIHDKCRKFAGTDIGSFNTVVDKVNMLKEKYNDYFKNMVTFNTVLDPQNDFNCINEFVMGSDLFKDSYFKFAGISNRYLKGKTVLGNQNYFQHKNYEYFKVMLHELGQLDKKYVSKIMAEQYRQVKLLRQGKHGNINEKLPDMSQHSGPCIPGCARLFVDVDGTFYPCERVSELSDVMKIGDIEHGFDLEKSEYLLNVGKISEDECKNCWAFTNCGICASAADDLKKLSYDVAKPFCIQERKNKENMLKDYCTLRELGHDLDADDLLSDDKIYEVV